MRPHENPPGPTAPELRARVVAELTQRARVAAEAAKLGPAYAADPLAPHDFLPMGGPGHEGLHHLCAICWKQHA